jgi:hypothetical protein
MPSRAYERALAEAARHHASSKTYSGKFLRPHKPWLLALVAEHQITSAIDYGAGKGAQYEWVDPDDGKTLEQAFGFEVTKYDPAWPPFAARPQGVFDLCICTHVLGSIPLADLGWVMASLYAYGRKAVYVAEKIGDVGKTALTAPEQRAVGWGPQRWMERLAFEARDYGYEGTVYYSAREAAEEGIRTRRWRMDPHGEFAKVFDSMGGL